MLSFVKNRVANRPHRPRDPQLRELMREMGIEWPQTQPGETEDTDLDSESTSSSSEDTEDEDEPEPDQETNGGAGENQRVEVKVPEKVKVLADSHGMKEGADALVPPGNEGWAFQCNAWAVAFIMKYMEDHR